MYFGLSGGKYGSFVRENIAAEAAVTADVHAVPERKKKNHMYN